MVNLERTRLPIVSRTEPQTDALPNPHASGHPLSEQIWATMHLGSQLNVSESDRNTVTVVPIEPAEIPRLAKEELTKTNWDTSTEYVIGEPIQSLSLSETITEEKPLPSPPLPQEQEKLLRDDKISREYSKLAYHEDTLTSLTANSRWTQDSEIPESFNRPFSLDSFVTATSQHMSYVTAPSFFSQDPSKSSSAGVRTRLQALLQRGKIQISRPIRPALSTTSVEDENLVKEEPPQYSDHDQRPFDELDWCGRGMHVDFRDTEIIPLQILSDMIGRGSTAYVDIVRCRRIKLARKIVILPPNRKITRQVLHEVHALQRLSHSHVIRLVGTYLHKRRFVTLLYPAAETNLEEYLEEVQQLHLNLGPAGIEDSKFRELRVNSNSCRILSKGSVCLLSGLRYLHNSGINHSDIKPANIILKEVRSANPDFEFHDMTGAQYFDSYRMYFCDFGTSRVLDPDGESQTEEDRGKTPRYAAPEVMKGDAHGRSSDIYALGYVLAEMATVYSGRLIEDFRNYITLDERGTTGGTPQATEETSRPFQAYYKHYMLDRIQDWFLYRSEMRISNQIICHMIHEDPEQRPRLQRPRLMFPDTLISNMICEHDNDGATPFEVEH